MTSLYAFASETDSGMTYREWLVGIIAAGYRANHAWADEDQAVIANKAIEDADAIIRALAPASEEPT